MKRDDFQKLAKLRLKEAQALLKGGHAPGAYYLAGLAVECAIKASIAAKTARFEFHDLKLAQASHVHKLDELIVAAKLRTDVDNELETNREFFARWQIVTKWRVESRYEHSITTVDAREMIDAVANKKAGVLRWLTDRWHK
jgi:HEPN domain-containing protein